MTRYEMVKCMSCGKSGLKCKKLNLLRKTNFKNAEGAHDVFKNDVGLKMLSPYIIFENKILEIILSPTRIK